MVSRLLIHLASSREWTVSYTHLDVYKRQVKGRVIDDEELKGYYAARQPYGEWLDSNMRCV